MTARGDPWQPSHSLGVAVIGHGYWELNLVRNFADLNSARDRSIGRPGDRCPGPLLSSVIQRMDQKARSKRP
jgi:hypothetical protein